MNNKREVSLAIIVPLALAISFAVLTFSFTIKGEPIVLVRLQDKFGFDFRDYHWAARYLFEGRNPWDWERFVTPPLSAIIMMSLSGFPPKIAIDIFFILNILLIVGGLFFYTLSFPLNDKWKDTLFLMIVSALFSHPVYFLLQRGNIDGLVFFFMALGVFFSTLESTWKNEIVAGITLAIAFHLKFYPILILFPILASRRWRLALLTCFFIAFLFLLTFNLWPDFIDKILMRQSIFTIKENGSLINSLIAIIIFPGYVFTKTVFVGMQTITFIGYGVFFILFCLLWRTSCYFARSVTNYSVAVLSVLCLPFMVLIPSLAYQYEYVHLLAFIPFIIWLESVDLLDRRYLYVLTVGIVVSQIHSTSLFLLTQNPLSYFLPGLGLLLVVFVCLKLAAKLPG